jgi:hypothetical protein
MSEGKEEQDDKIQLIHVTKDDIGITQFVIDPSKGRKVQIILNDTSSDISS